ncbi:hypothetical protein GCM10009567_12350 [Rothia amarae]
MNAPLKKRKVLLERFELLGRASTRLLPLHVEEDEPDQCEGKQDNESE